MLTTPVPRITGTCMRGTRVSSSPSKIPYGGVSPVRLQTGILPRPSPARSGSNQHPAPAYTRRKFLSPKRATSRRGTFVQAALPSCDRTLPSRGPWLASGLYCPAGSSLILTSSETLGSYRPTYDFAARSNLSRRVNQPILAVGLAPARQADLWAANRWHGEHTEKSCGSKKKAPRPLPAQTEVLFSVISVPQW